MQIAQPYRRAEELEAFLGSPLDPQNALSFKRSVEFDEAEQYPEQAAELLNEWGLHLYYIPRSEGGRQRSFDELLALVKIVARRDLTLAIAHGKTFLGAVSGWIGGSDDQKRRLAQIIKSHGQVALGLTERAHGSDVLAGDVQAIRSDHGYLLSGEKWLINNATRGAAITVLARTEANAGPRGFSLFLVEKDGLRKSSYSELQKIRTLGIRGADISGIRFNDCLVPHEALIGERGSGLEILLKGFQLTRTLIPALCLGAADTALRITLDFALSRKLYGDTVFALPHARATLVNAFLDLLICDCVTTGAARALHAAPDQMSLISALVKYYVPTTIESVMRNLSVVLGARHYLREGHCWGIFQKIVRDTALLSVFDGSQAVNLNAVSLQLRRLSERRRRGSQQERAEMLERLEKTFCLDAELAEFDAKKLSLNSRGRDDVVQGFEMAVAEVAAMTSEGRAEGEVKASIADMSRRLIEHLREQEGMLDEQRRRKEPAAGNSAEMFEMASRYSRVHAAAACVQVWLKNRERLGEFFRRGEWLEMSLERLVRSFEPERALRRRRYEAEVAHEMVRLYEAGYLFSFSPWRLAQVRNV